MRPATSCITCRRKRIKCERLTPTGPCRRCSRIGSSCSHEIEARDRQRAIAKAGGLESTGPVVQSLVEDYIRCIHDRPQTLFHEPTLRRSVQDGTLPQALLFAICSVGARFSHDATVRQQVQRYFDEARRLFNDDLENVSITNLQTCVVLANVFGSEDHPISETLYYSMARRMAQVLDLERPSLITTPIEHEVIKRVRLTLYIADCWHSRGSGISLMSHNHHLPSEPAVDEHIFHSPSFGQDGTDLSGPPGLWTHRIELATIFKKVQYFVAAVAEGTCTDNVADHEAETLATELAAWFDALPAATIFNEANLERHMSNGRGGAYIDLFLGYYYYTTLLFFPFLGRQLPTNAQQHPFVDKCRYHALRFSTLLQLTYERPRCEALHFTVGHMAVVSSSALLYFLLPNSSGDLPAIRAALLSNFVVIERLAVYWSRGKEWTMRLQIFHEALAGWSTLEPYTMDRWMMRFLLEYALPLDSRKNPVRMRSTSYENRDTQSVSSSSSPNMMEALQALL